MNKKKRRFRSAVSIVLSIAMLCGTIPMSVIAAEGENLRDVDFSRPSAITEGNKFVYDKEDTLREPKKYYSEPQPDGTLVAVDEYSKTYQTGDNSFITQLGGESNTYKDENGNVQLVDNTLSEKRVWPLVGYFENEANDYTVKLPIKITKRNGVEVIKDGYTIEMIPQGGDFSKPKAVDNAVLYNDVEDGIDYQYTVLGDTIKEDIVLNKAVNKHVFSFAIDAGKLKMAEKDGDIIIYEKDIEKPLFTIAAPEMSDASGEISTGIKLSLMDNVVTMTADKNWLQSPERAYPIRIDPAIYVTDGSIDLYGAQQGSPNTVIGSNNYPYCGYDDGKTSSNLSLYGNMHMMTRTYVKLNYNFAQISKEAKIESATFSVHHYTKWSKGKTVFGLYTVDQSWDPSKLSWNAQTGFGHTFIEYQSANSSPGWLNWNVREIVNAWVQGTATNNGFVIKAQDERNMQCEVFHNKRSSYKPILTINWSVPDPVDPAYPLNSLKVDLRPITEKDVNGKLLFDAIFADGIATPGAVVKYWLAPDNVVGNVLASMSYKYPDSTAFTETFPNGTVYKDKLSNWQTQLFGGLSYDKAYLISAIATLNGQSSKQADSDKFLIYKIKQTDTFPYIANYYGVPLNTIMRDNRVQDTLVVENNTIFIRNPKTEVAYSPEPLTDDAKKAIDSALMGRGLHCEYGFEPINLNTGNFYFNATDAVISDLGGDFAINRTYNSKGDATHSLFGRKWSFAYSETLSKCADGRISYTVGDGKVLYFTPDNKGGYIAPNGYHYKLKTISYTEGTETYYRYELHDTDGSYKKFNAWGLLSEIVDADGYITTISYDENYNISSITSPSGKVYAITCKEGRITEILLPNGSVLRYSYDESGNLTSYTDANGNTIRYVYDKQHRMIEWYDQEGNRVVQNKYDSQGRVTTQIDANGKKVTLTYKDNQTITTDANGCETTYTYDDQYRTVQIDYPDGKVEKSTYTDDNCLASDDNYRYTYDKNGNKLSETRKDGAVRKYTYNSKNQITSITEFSGTKTEFVYSLNGDLVQICYADGTTENYTYDSSHRVLTHTNANGNTESYTYEGAVAVSYTDYEGNIYTYHYDAMNQLVTIIAPDGSTSRKMYDASGVQIGEQSADGGYTEYTLNKVGNVVRITDPKGYASDFVYDGMYNIIKGTDKQGNTISYTYDGNGNKTSMTDALGHKTTYTYDSRNRLLKETDASGNTLAYAYDVDGNLLSKTDAEGNQARTEYDSVLHLPTQTTDALGGKTKYEYTVNGALKQVTYADGTMLQYEYDLKGRMTKFVDETGLVSVFVYDANGNVVTLKENDVRIYTYEYDKNNNLIKATDPMGGVVVYDYDKVNRQIGMTSELGNKTGYQYDPVGRLTKVVDAAGNAQLTSYDQNGNVQSVTDANGNETQYTYDVINNPISEKDAEGNITNYEYDGVQRLVSITDATGSTTKYEYDVNDNITKVTDGLGNIYTMEYDRNGNAKKITLPNGDVSTFTYDKLGRTIKTVDAAGLIKNYSYDSMGRVTKVTDNTGAKLTYKYDEYGRLISQTDVAGRSEKYDYDSFSQVIAVIGTDGNKTTFTYDALGRVLTSTDAEGKTTTFVYDAEGNLLQQTEADGAAYRYVYDSLNRVVQASDPVGAITSYAYDKNGNLLSTTDGNGVKNAYAYDKLNQLLTAVDGNGNATTYEYDELSRVIVLTEPEGGRTEYRYDAVGNMTKVKDANGYITEFVYDSVGNAIKVISQRGAEISYTYDKHNVLTETVDPIGNTTTYEVDLNGLTTKMIQPNGGEYTYAYDEVNRITGITTPNGYEKTFTYDKYGNLVKEKDNKDCTTTYEYDKMHRVTKVTDPSGRGTLYAYDESGNLASVLEANGGKTSYVYDLLDRITESIDPEGKITKLQYDLAGNITSITEQGGKITKLGYDNNYNLTSVTDPMGYVSSQAYDKNNRVISQINPLGQTIHYEYDGLGQTTKVTDASGASTRYAYDAHGNLTKVTNASGGETTYTYDLNDRLIQVTDPLQRVTDYKYDSMGNLIEQTDANGKKTTYTYDKEGNLTSLTDASGSTEKMTYDVVGNLKSIVRPDGTKVTYDYDKLNQLVSKTYSEDDTKVIYLYDSMGNRTSMTDEGGKSMYTYDVMRRITSVTSADKKTVSYAYDECGRLASITYADKKVVSYEYDLNDRLTKVTDGNKVTTYTYDALGRVIETERPDKSVTTYTYDVRGNLTKLENKDKDDKMSTTFVYTYNEQGYIAQEVATNSETIVTRTYAYNESGELVSFVEKEGLKECCYEYTYDKVGNRIRLEVKGGDHPETITYKYNGANQLMEENSTIDGKTLYKYDENGSLVSEEKGGKEVTYEYTVENRLKAVRSGGELLMAATYDGDGNRTFQISRKEAEQYVEKGDANDGKGNSDKPISESGETAGNVTGGSEETSTAKDNASALTDTKDSQRTSVNTYYEKVYDDPAETIFLYGFGQSVLQFFGGVNTAISAYLSDWFCHAWDFITGQYTLELHSTANELYSGEDVEALRRAGLSEEEIATITGGSLDAEGNVVVQSVESTKVSEKQVDSTNKQSEKKPEKDETIVIPANPDETTRVDYELTYYVNNVNTENTQVLMEYGKREELKNVYTYGNERISVETITDISHPISDGYETDYYLYDGRGSVTQVVNADEIVAEYTYDPFGNVITGAPQFDSFYGYNAEDTNPVTGLQYLRARYYDSASGRFHVKDTVLGDISEPLTLNRYSYTTNNPIMQEDPSGHFGVGVVLGLIAVGTVMTLTGCSKKNTDKEEKKQNSINASKKKVSKKQAQKEATKMKQEIEKLKEIDREIEEFASENKKVDQGKTLKGVIEELNSKRKKVCDTLRKREKIINKYNKKNPNETVKIPQLPNLEESPYPIYKYVQKYQLEDMGWRNVTKESLVELNGVLERYDIVTTEHIAHFLSQITTETAAGFYKEEVDWKKNGYAHVSGGEKYRGAGYIQLTHDYNYKEFGDYVGDSQVYQKGATYVAENYAWEAAGWYWSVNRDINSVIDGASDSVLEVTKQVNGGTSKLQERRENYVQAINSLNR